MVLETQEVQEDHQVEQAIKVVMLMLIKDQVVEVQLLVRVMEMNQVVMVVQEQQ